MGLVHAKATLMAKPQADTMQHTVLPTMHRLSSVTHKHAHSPPRPEGARARPAGAPSRPLQPHTHLEVVQPAVPPWRAERLESSPGRPQCATPGRDQPAPNKGCEQAAGAACIPAPRRGGSGGAARGPRAATAPARSALPAPRALRLPRSRSLPPATAAAVRLPHRTHQLFIARLQLPGRSQSQAEAPLMGPPPPRKQPAARPGASDTPPGTGMGTGGARGGGDAPGAQEKLPTARRATPRSWTPQA